MKDGISKVKSEIKGVMGIMQGNIAKVLDRGAKLEDLQDKSGTACNMVLTVCNIVQFQKFSEGGGFCKVTKI